MSSRSLAHLSPSSLAQQAKLHCFVPLSEASHKGSSGRIGVLGGSDLYTGAPYYAGMSALQAGADLAYVFTAREASLAIKSYSPELMVVPVYSAAHFDQLLERESKERADDGSHGPERDTAVAAMVQVVEPWLDRMHCLIVGPGLGRCPIVMEATAKIIEMAKSKRVALVVDADALFLLTQYKDLIAGYRKVVLTPNAVEYQRLVEHKVALTGATVIQKGRVDLITVMGDGESDGTTLECTEQGGFKRSGGIGDVLAGTLGTFLAWQTLLSSSKSSGLDEDRKKDGSPADTDTLRLHWQLACWTACCVVKRATRQAYELKRRSMTAPDVLAHIGATVNRMETDTELDS
jgi:ATP-dependent NAD(P)H-hydrate dehydratase